MIALGMDPSLNNWANVLVKLHNCGTKFDVEEMLLTETSPGKNKKTVRKNSDDLDRARILNESVKMMEGRAAIAFAEVPVGSQSARAMASYGVCIGVLSRIEIPLIQLTPYEVKLASVGSKTATKREMIEWAMEKYPDAAWVLRAGKAIDKNEHLADAIATVEAGIKTDQFKGAMAAMAYMRKAG